MGEVGSPDANRVLLIRALRTIPPGTRYSTAAAELEKSGYALNGSDKNALVACGQRLGQRYALGVIGGVAVTFAFIRYSRVNPAMQKVVRGFKPITLYIVSTLAGGYFATLSGRYDCVQSFAMADSPLGERIRNVANSENPDWLKSYRFPQEPMHSAPTASQGGPISDVRTARISTEPSKDLEISSDPYSSVRTPQRPFDSYGRDRPATSTARVSRKDEFEDDDHGAGEDFRQEEEEEEEEVDRNTRMRGRGPSRTLQRRGTTTDDDDFATAEAENSRWSRPTESHSGRRKRSPEEEERSRRYHAQ